MHLDQLKYFISVCDNRSLTLASQELFITQQSLSISISKLEKEVGTPLLHRTNRGVYPTEAGKKVYLFAEKFVHAWTELKSTINDHNKQINLIYDTIKINSAPSFQRTFFPNIIYKASQLYPNIKFPGNITDLQTSVAELQQKNIDCALANIAYNDSPQELLLDNPELNFIPLSNIKIYVWVNAFSPLSKKTILKFNDIKNYKILFSASSDITFFKNIFQNRFEELDTAFFKSSEVLANYIEHNLENIALDISIENFGLSLNTFLQNKNNVAYIPFDIDISYKNLVAGLLLNKNNPKNALIQKIFFDLI